MRSFAFAASQLRKKSERFSSIATALDLTAGGSSLTAVSPNVMGRIKELVFFGRLSLS